MPAPTNGLSVSSMRGKFSLVLSRIPGKLTFSIHRPYIAACLCGCWLTDPLNNLLGRRGAIFISAIFCTLSVIGAACSQTWQQLFVSFLACYHVGPSFHSRDLPRSVAYSSVLVWVARRQRSLSLPLRILPQVFVVVLLCLGRCG